MAPIQASLRILLGALVGLSAAAAVPQAAVASTMYNVTAYGADPSGSADSTRPIQAAIDAAQGSGGGTVYFPAGHYVLRTGGVGASLHVQGAAPITILGAGRDTTEVSQLVGSKQLIGVRTDGSVIRSLTLETRSAGTGGTVLSVHANHTRLVDSRIVGGSGGNLFALYYSGNAGPAGGPPGYDQDNQLINDIIIDDCTKDGISWSFQQGSLIQNISQTGSRLAIYRDADVLVDGYQYAPGPQTGGTDGFWITPPSSGITIRNFVTSGAGGVIGRSTSFVSTKITIDGERMTSGSRYSLHVGDVRGLVIRNSVFEGSESVTFYPWTVADSIAITDSSVPTVRFGNGPGAPVSNLSLTNVTFPAFTPALPRNSQTFMSSNGGPADITISGGHWCNQAGGWSAGKGMTFHISGLGRCA